MLYIEDLLLPTLPTCDCLLTPIFILVWSPRLMLGELIDDLSILPGSLRC